MSEADLYQPVKELLEAQGYTVKGEIGPCDVVAMRGDEPPVVVELKKQFNLALVLQGVERLSVSDTVYIAFRVGKKESASWRTKRKSVLSLLRRLGIGLITVSSRGNAVAVLDPSPYQPRTNKRKKQRLLKEFSERVGDPEVGGSSSRQRLTAYRQDAIRCAAALSKTGVLKASVVRDQSGVEKAGVIMLANHYGWFERVERGYYALSPKGARELPEWHDDAGSMQPPG